MPAGRPNSGAGPSLARPGGRSWRSGRRVISPEWGSFSKGTTIIRGSRPQGISCRRPDCKPWPKFSWSICRRASKRGLFRPPIAPYLPSPNFPPCPTATIGCSAAAPTRCVRPPRSSRRVRRQSWTPRGRWRGSLDLAKVLLSYLIIKVSLFTSWVNPSSKGHSCQT